MATMLNYSVHDSLNDLRVDIIRHLGTVALLMGSFALWRAINIDPVSWKTVLLLLSMVIVSWATKKIVYHNLQQARYIAVWGSNGLFITALLSFRDPYIPFFAALLIFVNGILIWRGELISAIMVFVTSIYLAYWRGYPYPLTSLFSFLSLSVVIAWLSVYTLHTAVQWYGTMHHEARGLLEEVRDQRATLMRTFNSLEVAYATQQRHQKEIMQARREAEEARQMKERFVANISHELRTPLNLIFGFSEVMYLSPETYGDVNWTPLLSRDIHQVYRSSRHLMEMIDDILDLSYFEQAAFTINLEPTAISDFMQDTVDLAANLFRDSPLEFRAIIAPDLHTIEIDRTRIRQVILNLLSNAKRFTNEGYVHLEAYLQDHNILVSVTDTGSGIKSSKIPHIFDEYYQVDYSLSRKHGGAGLGLAISKKFILAHHGTIWVKSEEGIGSTFTFALPVFNYKSLLSKPADQETQNAPASGSIIALDIQDDFLKQQLKRHLNELEIVYYQEEEIPPHLFDDLQARAVLSSVGHNSANTLEREFPIPHIQCCFPNLVSFNSPPNVKGYLAKPITSSLVIRAIQQFPSIKQILIIDVVPEFCQLLERYIQSSSLDIKVLKAYDEPEAINIMQQQPIDLVFMDVAIEQKAGQKISEKMQQDASLMDIPIYMLTTAESLISKGTENRNSIRVIYPIGHHPANIFETVSAVVDSLKRYF